jgi:hypothetical protein
VIHDGGDWTTLGFTVILLSNFIVVLVSAGWMNVAARGRDLWSPAYCREQGFLLGFCLAGILYGTGHVSAWLAILLGVAIAVTTSQIALKRIYPTISDEITGASNELPTMFPK